MRVHELGNEGARLLIREPALAAAKFEVAHELALQLGMMTEASKLSCLLARSWQGRNAHSRCIYFSRRAVRDEPREPSAHSTLGHFCENAAITDARAGKLRRSLRLFVAAANAYATAARLEGDVSRAEAKSKIAEDIRREAQQVFADWWDGKVSCDPETRPLESSPP